MESIINYGPRSHPAEAQIIVEIYINNSNQSVAGDNGLSMA